jgi:hypothetical protein
VPILKTTYLQTNKSSQNTKSLKLISVLLLCGLLSLLFSSTSVYSTVKTSRTVSSYGLIRTPAVKLFETGFETGDLSEVGLEEAWGGSVNIYSGESHSGSYSANCSGPAYGRGRIYPRPSISQLAEVHIRAYFYFETLEGYVQCIRTAGHTIVDGTRYYSYLARVQVAQDYIRLQIGMDGKNPGDWLPDPAPIESELSAIYNFELGTWYCIELSYIKAVTGGARIWVNGEQVVSYVGDTSNSPDIDNIIVGLVLCGADTEIYVDDFVVADGYIGQ